MLLTTYKDLRTLEEPTAIYDSEGKIEELYYLDSVIPPSVVVHYTHGFADQKDIDTPIVCYYQDVEIHESEILWYLGKHSRN